MWAILWASKHADVRAIARFFSHTSDGSEADPNVVVSAVSVTSTIRSSASVLYDACAKLDYMSADGVVRSVRLERVFDQQIEALAAERGLTVSAYIRDVLAKAAERDDRRRKLEQALELASSLPEAPRARDEMWATERRVPG